MALRAAGDDYEHSAIQNPQRAASTGPRAPFRGEWVEKQSGWNVEVPQGVSHVPVKLDRGLCVDIIADAIYAAQPMAPSAAVAIAEAILEKLHDSGYVISRS